jgi:histidinol-phosphate aminotransferase
MSINPRQEISELRTCVHGGPNFQELEKRGIKPDDIIDFSVSSNPFSYPPGVNEAFNRVVIDRYPDSISTKLRQALSEKLLISQDNVLVGSGSMEIIRAVALAYFTRGGKVLILQPTFGEYEVAVLMMGGEMVEQRATEENGFAFDISKAIRTAKKQNIKALFLCNPNNPTGSYLEKDDIKRLLASLPDTLILLDEAYIAFTDNAWDATKLTSIGNLIIIRSMTKDYALAGLRLGYAISSENIIEILSRVVPPWNVNSVAQEAGLVALADDTYLDNCQRKIREAKNYLEDEFRKMGYDYLKSQTNFFIVKVGEATTFRSKLLDFGIIVRDCSSFGLSEYIRIAPRSMSQCRKLIETIQYLRKTNKLDENK